MITRYIPMNYDYDGQLVNAAIQSFIATNSIVLGPQGWGFRGRIFYMDATLTAPQGVALKAAVLPLLTATTDVTT